jgi:hypothetical protein
MQDVIESISLLDKADQRKIAEFVQILLNRDKYQNLRKEVEARRAEIEKGEVVSHDDIWSDG